MPYADPVGGSQGARALRVVDDVAQFQERQGKMWQDKQKRYVGQTGSVELVYPNGDVALCFDDGEWVRVAQAALLTADGQQVRAAPASPPQAAAAPPVVSSEAAPAAAYAVQLGLAPGDETGLVYRDVDSAVVEDVVPGSAAAQHGVRPQSTITHVDHVPVRHSGAVEGAIRNGAAVRGYAVLNLDATAHAAPVAAPVPTDVHVAEGSTLESAEAALAEAERRLQQMQEEVARLRGVVEERKAVAVAPAPVVQAPVAPVADAEAIVDAAEAEEPQAKKKKKKKSKDIPIAVPINDKDDLLRVFEKMDFGKRREGAEKDLAAMGDPSLEDLEFWDLRSCTEDDLEAGLDQVALEMFYFGEIKEAGEPNTFKVNVMDRLAKAGVTGIVAPCALKEAGCMYPLIGIPFTIPWEEAVKFGNLVFEEFGLKQDSKAEAHGDKAKEGTGGDGKEEGCGQQ
eukprot:TRINITY_DN13654_c0_g1_i1.p1 TRINITY_DN13654_c0_g1~~TRINITY_DN13654_c0_g1_i1.p1  ORF type:complete len:454 (+),score=174.72 TRINITY_DN13654_c0_g1_i1:56-1417(+)